MLGARSNLMVAPYIKRGLKAGQSCWPRLGRRQKPPGGWCSGWFENEKCPGLFPSAPPGSLSEELLVGDIMVPRNAIRDEAGHGNAPWPLQQVKDCGVKAGNTIVTVKAFVANSSERARLSETYHADLVDMSAAEIADVCASRHIPCAIIREISDLADEEAPRSFVGTSRRQQPRMVQAALCAVRQLGVDKVADEHK